MKHRYIVQNRVATGKLIVGIDTGGEGGAEACTHTTLPVFLSRDANPCWPGARISHPRRGSLSWPRLRVRTRRGSRDSCLDCRISGATPLKSLGKQPQGIYRRKDIRRSVSPLSLSPLPETIERFVRRKRSIDDREYR